MNLSVKQLLMAAAVTGIVTAGPLSNEALAAKKVKGECTEKNSCNGRGHCAGKANGKEHDCSGKNACSPNHIKDTTKKKCDKYEGTWKANES